MLKLSVVVVLLGLVAGTAFAASPAAGVGLSVTFVENPFVCDGDARALGTVSGLDPNEPMEFSSAQLGGVFSSRTADAAGQVAMTWQCSVARTRTVTAAGLVSGRSVTFDIVGIAAVLPDAPLGSAFDARSAPSVADMATWISASPYRGVGVYIAVNAAWDNRSDKVQTNLNATWVTTVAAQGWSIAPIYVGPQAPAGCQTSVFHRMSTDPAVARQQGVSAAADAVTSMTALGFGPGAPIYYDLEAYTPGCEAAVRAFLDGWTEQLHLQGYLSGVYGSRNSTMNDLVVSAGIPGFDVPDAVWVATGNGQPSSLGLGTPPDGLWTTSRLHQFRLNIFRSYGGVGIWVDENIVAGPLALPGTPLPTTPMCNGLVVTVNLALGHSPTAGPDVILGTTGPDVIKAFGGDDVVCGEGGDDHIDGGHGNDTIFGGDGRDVVSGGPGDDHVEGGPSVDHLRGGAGEDTLIGDGGSDRIFGGDGDDVIRAGSGADRVSGGSGADQIFGMGGQDRLRGDAGADVIQGSHQSDDIRGGAGDDVLRGAKGKDTIEGQSGDDQLFGGVNSDVLIGGPGADLHDGQQGRDQCVSDGNAGDTFTSC